MNIRRRRRCSCCLHARLFNMSLASPQRHNQSASSLANGAFRDTIALIRRKKQDNFAIRPIQALRTLEPDLEQEQQVLPPPPSPAPPAAGQPAPTFVTPSDAAPMTAPAPEPAFTLDEIEEFIKREVDARVEA